MMQEGFHGDSPEFDCPTCGRSLTYDTGSDGDIFDPPQAPSWVCKRCDDGWSEIDLTRRIDDEDDA